MTTLSAETRRMLELSRAADVPAPSRERAVRDRLMAELGAAALAGAAVSTASAGAEAVATTTGTLSAAGSPGVAVGSTTQALGSAATSIWTKTVAGLIIAAGLGAGASDRRAIVDRSEVWVADIATRTEQLARRSWSVIAMHGGGEAISSRGDIESIDRSVDFDERRHALLVAIARRPNHPVAIEAELVLILRAEQALAASDGARAAKYLDAHEANFEAGALTDNREVLRVLVDCARGAEPEARAGAERFATRFADSDQLVRLRACPFTAPVVDTRSNKSKF